MAKKRTILLLIFVPLLLLMVAAIGLALMISSSSGATSVASATIVEIDFEKQILEYVPHDPFAQLMAEKTPVLRDLTDALEKAAADDRVKGLVARVGTAGLGIAQMQEARDAVLAFRESGKPTVAFAETFGELSSGNGSYYLASAFEEIHLQPSGDVNLTGLMGEGLFVKEMLDKMGLEAHIGQRYEYKNAANSFKQEEFTDAHREATESMMRSVFDQMVAGIAAARGMDEGALRALIDRGPFLGQEALDEGLVDALNYRDGAYAEIREKAGEDAELLYFNKYLKLAGRPNTSGKTVALIYGVGQVTRGPSEYDPLTGSANMGSDSVAAALRSAIDDDAVEAIVFRVDSPGGSYVASDTIWRETVRAEEAGKPVVVSMGNLAASGGYFVSMSSAKIVAQPATLTGSIGVFGGKMYTSAMWDKLGIAWDSVKTSENATIYAGNHPYSESQQARIDNWLDRVYEDFTSKVAEGRGRDVEEIREIAKGRVWTGQQALENGLVDALGGLNTALDVARQEIGLEPDAEIRLKAFPREKTPFQLLFSEGPDSSERAAVLALGRVLESVRPVALLARRLGLVEPENQVLRMPEIEVR